QVLSSLQQALSSLQQVLSSLQQVLSSLQQVLSSLQQVSLLVKPFTAQHCLFPLQTASDPESWVVVTWIKRAAD
ncbi:MAG: hypothetical protein ACR2NZ_19050, partial [Rubripirellula sp.]